MLMNAPEPNRIVLALRMCHIVAFARMHRLGRGTATGLVGARDGLRQSGHSKSHKRIGLRPRARSGASAEGGVNTPLRPSLVCAGRAGHDPLLAWSSF